MVGLREGGNEPPGSLKGKRTRSSVTVKALRCKPDFANSILVICDATSHEGPGSTSRLLASRPHVSSELVFVIGFCYQSQLPKFIMMLGGHKSHTQAKMS
ncbi:hypothetical protein ANN_13076 [Periplaneta americana]|uniref:Uncharacterized protein n=1 Tax=Periplaneta americana TaxID=6978 RepID=A0ABQ8TII8_PERAM|nr:hypothetical protein ANN_13076 [Periplaneta americana]